MSSPSGVFLVSECFLCWLVYNWKSPKSDFLKKWALSPEGWSVFIFSYWTQRKLVPADNHVWNFSHQCSIFGCISNQWAVILSPRCSTKLTVSQQRHLVSFVRIPSKISWTHVGSVLQFCCDPPFVVPAEEMLLLLLTLLVLLCLSFSFSFAFSPSIESLVQVCVSEVTHAAGATLEEDFYSFSRWDASPRKVTSLTLFPH